MQVQWLECVFEVYNLDTVWNKIPGVYIFTRQEQDLRGNVIWKAIYVGETGSLQDRLNPTHEKWHSAIRLGLSHIHAVVEQSSARRFNLEARLIQTYKPDLNRQHA